MPTNASDATREYGQSRSAREVWGALTGACIMLVAHQRLSNDFFFLESSAICEHGGSQTIRGGPAHRGLVWV